MSTQVVAGAPIDPHAAAAVRAWTRLLRAHAVTTRLLNARLADHGLTVSAYEALALLGAAEDRRLRRVDLARGLQLTASGVTRLLEGLEEDGLVERASCPGDRRVTYALLTTEGARVLREASCRHVRSVEAMLEEHLADDEIEALAILLGKIPGVAEPV